MDPATVYGILQATGVLTLLSGWLGHVIAHQPGALSVGPGFKWYQGWYVGHELGEEDEYPALYSGEATILVNTLQGEGLPVARWSNGSKRLIPLQAITVQGIPIFADSPDDPIVTENLNRTWSLLGHTNRENEKWARTMNLLSPGSTPAAPTSSVGLPSLLLPVGAVLMGALTGHPLLGLAVGAGSLILRGTSTQSAGRSR